MTDVAILNKAGVYHVKKNSTIVSMNAELNMKNRKLGRHISINRMFHVGHRF
jgi:hypothetical protein